jgi:gliding motility-associated-like protein
MKYQLMNFNLKIVILFILTISFTGAFSQDSTPISDEGLVESTNCDNGITITDSNADDGDYLPGETYEITACINTLVGDSVQITILPPINQSDTVNVWDVDENSTLSIFAGEGTDGDLLGVFNSETDPNGVYLTTIVPCVTFVWESGAFSSGEGFIAQINCLQDLQPFNVSVFIDPPFGLSTDTFPDIGPNENVITFCFGDTLSFTANPTFPLSDATGDGYEQLLEESTFTWDMGNGDIFEGVGLNELTYGFPEPGGYFATLTVTDIMGQEETYDAYLLMAPRPIFSNIVFGDTLCLGDTTVITGGIDFPDTVGVSPNTSAVQPNYDFTDSRYLPDGSGELYETVIEIEGYLNDPQILNPGDFVNVCINMEHSYLGDLEAWLTCPNGQSALLFDGFAGDGLFPGTGFGGGGTFLGDAYDNNIGNEGIGFDYCFSDDGDLGTMQDEFIANNTVPVNTFVMGNAMVAGTYLPAENFETAFQGCPLNGDWTLSIGDNLTIDDGFIFNWSMEFGPNFELDTIYYTPDIVDAYWLENPDILQGEFASDTSIVIVPGSEGNNQYTFIVEDSFGCIHDTTFLVYVRPLPELNDRTACDRMDQLFPSNSPQGGSYEVIDTPDENSQLIFGEIGQFGQVDISITENDLYGDYFVEYTEQICGLDSMVSAYVDTVRIDFRPYPQIAPFFEDSVLCGGATIALDAGPQEENSETFNINWTIDGSTFNASDLSVSVDQSGLYVLTMFEPACPDSVVSDTTFIQAIDIDFSGDTICGLTPTIKSVEVMPESIGGMWSAEDEGIIFSQPNAIFTDIIPPDFGTFEISYTDVRCPNDAVSRNILWYKQPDLTILPQDPTFCFEDDSLNLTAVLEGEGSGVYFWELTSINGGAQTPATDFDFDQFQQFPPESFEPIEAYMVTVVTFDEYGRCPQPGRDTLVFVPLACQYNIPNIITPNGDGQNDLFAIQYIEFFPNASLSIFNRWGQEVFSSGAYNEYQEENEGWDPEDLPGGVYFYELKLPTLERVETGELTIITQGG